MNVHLCFRHKKKNTLHSKLINKVFNSLTLTALHYLYSPSHDQVYLRFHQWSVALATFQTKVSQKHFSDLLISFVVSFKRNFTANVCILSHTAAGIRVILARLLTFEKRKLFPEIHLVMGAEKATYTFTGKQSLSRDKNNSTTEAETAWASEGMEGNRSRHRGSADEGIEIHSSCLPLSLSPSSPPLFCLQSKRYLKMHNHPPSSSLSSFTSLHLSLLPFDIRFVLRKPQSSQWMGSQWWPVG